MKINTNSISNAGGIGRGVPLALLFTVLLQGGAAVWWVSAKARDGFFLEQRVSVVEDSLAQRRKTDEVIGERLVRIEERVNAQIVLLDRIEKQLLATRRSGERE